MVGTLEEPTSKGVREGVQAISKVPAVVGREYEDGEELHPFWELLELAGYELL